MLRLSVRGVLAAALLSASLGAPLAAADRSGERQVAWLRAEAIALRSFAPDDGDFSDLEPLRAVLAGKRVVILGEASHRDGNTLLAKTRLIRFLHREPGFDVLAFESGFYDCAKAWERIVAGDDPAEAFRQSVFAIWTRSAQMQPLIDYFAAAARSPRPLELAGFDSQFTGEMSGRHLAADLRRVAVAAGISGEDFDARVSGPLANLVGGKHEEGQVPPEAARAGFDAARLEQAAAGGPGGLRRARPPHGRAARVARPPPLRRPQDRGLGGELSRRAGGGRDRGAVASPHAFLDLSRAERLPGWLRKPTIARPMGYKEMRAPWGRVFDAVLFLDRMEPSAKRE